MEIHSDRNSFYLSFYPECINLSFQLDNCPVCCVYLVCLWPALWYFFLLCLPTAVHQPQAPVCLSPWRWRRIIVVAVTSWPSVDTSWTGTSSRFTLSTLPAMMLWVIWQPANEHSEVLWPCFLSNSKEGLCEWGTAWGHYFHPSILFSINAARYCCFFQYINPHHCDKNLLANHLPTTLPDFQSISGFVMEYWVVCLG